MQGTRAVEPSLTVGLLHWATALGYCTGLLHRATALDYCTGLLHRATAPKPTLLL